VQYAFVLGFALLTLAIVAAGYLYYRRYERTYRTQVESQLSAIGQLKADGLALWRAERLAGAAVLAQNPIFPALAQRYLEDPAEDAQAQGQLQAWLGSYRALGPYDQVLLLDMQGTVRLAIPSGTSSVSSAISQRIPDVLQSGQATFVDFYRDDQDQRVRLAVLVPILVWQGGNRATGVVVFRIDPATYLYPFISSWPTPSATAETLLVRRDGNDALFLNELRFRKNTALTLRIPLSGQDVPAVMAALGQETIVEGIDYRGVRVLADLLPVRYSPWSLVAKMDTSEVYAPLRARLWQLALLVGVGFIGAGVGLGFLLRIRLQEQLKEQAIRDPLTAAYNRHYFNEAIQQEIARSKRYGHPVAFLMVDVNRFKEINDRFGHQLGDRVLQAVADVLRQNVRECDTVIRYGGDEFLVILPETNGKADVAVERIHAAIARRNVENPLLEFPVTLAIGIDHWQPTDPRPIEIVLREADRRMYEDKTKDRGSGGAL
jgi:diguanylate cyclase (GGDEF)-like protein